VGPSSRNSAGCLVRGADRLYPLDVFRFHLLPKPNGLVSFFGLALYVAGWWIITLAMKVNPFAVPVVRLQEERHQRVIDTGVYAVVRHPMYTGFVPMAVGPALWLESYVAALLAIVPSRCWRCGAYSRSILEAGIERLRRLH
jgi:protein-S-isoprenylcysteine O-methyltransferase Ste14